MTPGKKGFELRLGEILILNGWITWDQLEKALEVRKQTHEKISDILVYKGLVTAPQGQLLHLGEIMVQKNMITWEQLAEGLKVQRQTGNILGEILFQKGYVTLQELYQALALQYEKVFVDFSKITIQKEALEALPKRLAYQYRVMPLVLQDGVLLIAISNPNDVRPEAELPAAIDLDVQTALAPPDDINAALRKHYGSE